MTRLFLTRAGTILSATLCLECSGQNVEGLWIGGFPGSDSPSCQIRLKDDNRFSLTCPDRAFMEVGSYRWDGKALRIETAMSSINGTLVPAKPVYRFEVIGHGNRLEVAVGDRVFHWTRRLP